MEDQTAIPSTNKHLDFFIEGNKEKPWVSGWMSSMFCELIWKDMFQPLIWVQTRVSILLIPVVGTKLKILNRLSLSYLSNHLFLSIRPVAVLKDYLWQNIRGWFRWTASSGKSWCRGLARRLPAEKSGLPCHFVGLGTGRSWSCTGSVVAAGWTLFRGPLPFFGAQNISKQLQSKWLGSCSFATLAIQNWTNPMAGSKMGRLPIDPQLAATQGDSGTSGTWIFHDLPSAEGDRLTLSSGVPAQLMSEAPTADAEY